MKKGKSQIPDFSQKRKGGKPPEHGVPDTTKPAQHVPNPPVHSGKPPATSQKSGRRGS